jgi:hypothetical protein
MKQSYVMEYKIKNLTIIVLSSLSARETGNPAGGL